LLAAGCLRPNLFGKDGAVSPSPRIIQKHNALPRFISPKLLVHGGARHPRFGRLTGELDLIQGGLLILTNPPRDLSPIDWLEGFWPGGRSICQWAAAVGCKRTITPARTYWALRIDICTELDSGV